MKNRLIFCISALVFIGCFLAAVPFSHRNRASADQSAGILPGKFTLQRIEDGKMGIKLNFCISAFIFIVCFFAIALLIAYRTVLPWQFSVPAFIFAITIIIVYLIVGFLKTFLIAFKTWPLFVKAGLWAIGVAVSVEFIIFGIPYLSYLLANYIHHFGGYYSAADTKATEISGADYLSAAATIIGSIIGICVSLIPLFVIIKQLKSQLNQNDADMFLRACGVLKKGCSDIEMWGALVSLKELLEGKNRKLKKDEGLAFYRSQVIVIIERLLQKGRISYIENYKMCFYILKESIIDKYLEGLNQGSIKITDENFMEVKGNIKRCIRIFLCNFRWAVSKRKKEVIFKVFIKTIARFNKSNLRNICGLVERNKPDGIITRLKEFCSYFDAKVGDLSPKYTLAKEGDKSIKDSAVDAIVAFLEGNADGSETINDTINSLRSLSLFKDKFKP